MHIKPIAERVLSSSQVLTKLLPLNVIFITGFGLFPPVMELQRLCSAVSLPLHLELQRELFKYFNSNCVHEINEIN